MKVSLPGPDNQVVIDVVVSDPVLAQLVDRYPVAQMDERAALVADALEIGARMIQRQQDGVQGDLLRREVERMEGVIARAQSDLVRLAGADFAQAVSQVMNAVSTQLGGIEGRLDGALAVSAKEQELQAERERGTAKGRPFEQEVAEYVEHVAGICGDTATATGDVGGITGRAGDVVVEVGGASGAPKGTIVFEVKTGKLSKPEAMREMDRALQSRGADFAVLVVSSRSKVPANTFDLREYGGNKIVVAVDDEIGTSWLELAYSLARARVLQSSVDSDGADVGSAQASIEHALQLFDGVRSIKLRMTSIISAADDTKAMVEAMVESVKGKLEDAQEALQPSQKLQ